MQNGLIDPVILTFDLSTPNHITSSIFQLLPVPNLNTLGLFVFELCCGQTNKQADGTERATHADRQSRRG